MRAVRLSDWEPRLYAWFDTCATTPHDYGRHDCGLFVAGGVAAMTGFDFAAPFRGRYSTALGATRALRRHGGGDMAAVLTRALGDPVPRAFAHRGDIVRYNGVPGFLMADHAVFVGRAEGDPVTFGIGLVRVPRHALDADAWAVPYE